MTLWISLDYSTSCLRFGLRFQGCGQNDDIAVIRGCLGWCQWVCNRKNRKRSHIPPNWKKRIISLQSAGWRGYDMSMVFLFVPKKVFRLFSFNTFYRIIIVILIPLSGPPDHPPTLISYETSMPQGHFGPSSGREKITWATKKSRGPLLSIESWLFSRDPYIGLLVGGWTNPSANRQIGNLPQFSGWK